jgi:hypothetical protein
VPRDDRRAIQLDDDEHGRLHAVWSRSGKHLIVTATTDTWDQIMPVELQPDQVNGLIAFLADTVALQSSEG